MRGNFKRFLIWRAEYNFFELILGLNYLSNLTIYETDVTLILKNIAEIQQLNYLIPHIACTKTLSLKMRKLEKKSFKIK